MGNFNRKLMEVNIVNFNKFIDILADFQVIYPQYDDGFTNSNKVVLIDKFIYNENFECYCLPVQINDENVYVKIPSIITTALKRKIYNINKNELFNVNVIILSFYRKPYEEISKYEYILNLTNDDLNKILISSTEVIKFPKSDFYSVKDFMKKEGYMSVHKILRANSEHFFYVTFIKENNSAMNVYISKRASKSFYEGQEIIKGFFDNLLIAKIDEKIVLVSSTDYSELNLF